MNYDKIRPDQSDESEYLDDLLAEEYGVYMWVHGLLRGTNPARHFTVAERLRRLARL